MKVFFMIVLLFLLSSCSNAEIEEYAIIAGIGIDYIDEEYVLTTEIVQDNSGETNKAKSEVITVKGNKFSSCVEMIKNVHQNVPYLSHCQLIIIGDELAKHGIDEVLYYILHSQELRYTVDIIVAKESTAEEMLNNQNKNLSIMSFGIIEQIKNNQEQTDIAYSTSFFDIINKIFLPNNVIIVPICFIENERIVIREGALFKNEELKEYLDIHDVNAIKILKSKLSMGVIELPCGLTPMIRETKTNYSYQGNYHWVIKTKIKIGFFEQPKEYDLKVFNDQKEVRYLIENDLKLIISEQIKKYQKHNYDVLDLKNWIYTFSPFEYEKIEKSDDFLRDFKIDYEIETILFTDGYANGKVGSAN